MFYLSQGSLSVSTHYTSDWTDLFVDIPMVSLQLDAKNMQLIFENDGINQHLANILKGSFDNINEFLLRNSNDYAADTKDFIQKIHQDLFSYIDLAKNYSLPNSNETLHLYYKPTGEISQNPVVKPEFMSSIYEAFYTIADEYIDKNNFEDHQIKETYLPIHIKNGLDF